MPIATRCCLAYLGLMGLAVGVWAYAIPHSFYADFPGLGRSWVSMDGPFNQHLVRDVGAAFLMLGTLASIGLLRPKLAQPFAVGAATLAFNLLHLTYHAGHLGMFSLTDRILNVAVLSASALCSAWLLMPQARVRP